MKKTKESPPENAMQKSSVKAPELDMLKKIAMLNSLASSCEDKDLMEAFSKLKNGQTLFDIFVKAVNKEIQMVVNGKETETTRAVTNAKDISNSLYDQVQTMYNMMAAISGSPIMKVMAITHDRLTGTSIADTLRQHASVPVHRPPNREELETAEAAVVETQEAPQETGASTPSQQPAHPPLRKKYADGRGDIQPAPVLPPRGGSIGGLF